MPTMINFAGGNGTWRRKSKKKTQRFLVAYQTSCLTENSREGVDELNDRLERVDELPILVPKFLELVPALLEKLKDGTRRIAGLGLFGERIVPKIYLHAFSVIVQCIANQLEVWGRHWWQ